MNLEINGEVLEGTITPELVEQSVYRLLGDDAFLILSHDSMTYIQAAGNPTTGFVLEYQDGSLEQHFSCATPTLGTGDITRAFQSYLAGDDRWKTDFTWESADDAFAITAETPLVKTIIFVLVAVIAIGWVLYKLS